MNTIIERLNGTVYDLEELGIQTTDFNPGSFYPVHETETLPGGDGAIDLGTTYGYRQIKASFLTETEDFTASRNEIFRMFRSKEAFYITDTREPLRRWLVKVDGGFSIEQEWRVGTFEVTFICHSGYAESYQTTLNMIVAGMSGNKEQKYKHATSSFEILNDGDETINPRRYPLVIEFKGASTNLQIKNLTTGDTWTYTGTTAAGDIIKLDRIRSTKNELSIFRDTNRKLITLAPGWNAFQLVGASGAFEVSFDFRFYTL